MQEGVSAETWWQRSEEDWTEEERLLACCASAVADLRAAVKAELGFTCSAGPMLCFKSLFFCRDAISPYRPVMEAYATFISIL